MYTYMYMYIATVRSRGSLGDFWSNNVNICAYYICDCVCVYVNIYYKKIKTMFPLPLPPYSTCTCTCTVHVFLTSLQNERCLMNSKYSLQ